MAINIRTKGANGEREVCDLLNKLLQPIIDKHGISEPEKPVFQRNQNQTAVGGSDITNPFDLCIEVKRQEQLNINTWWQQCLTASNEFGGIPILIYRQNGKRKWNVVMFGMIAVGGPDLLATYRVSLDQADFENWFTRYVDRYLGEHDVFKRG